MMANNVPPDPAPRAVMSMHRAILKDSRLCFAFRTRPLAFCNRQKV